MDAKKTIEVAACDGALMLAATNIRKLASKVSLVINLHGENIGRGRPKVAHMEVWLKGIIRSAEVCSTKGIQLPHASKLLPLIALASQPEHIMRGRAE
jgi:hypothetical protein